MDTVHTLIDYLESFPPEAGADELKSQLSAFMHQDLRAACMRLNLPISRRQNKKGGFISILVAYWKTAIPVTSVPQATKLMPMTSSPPSTESHLEIEHPDDVAQFVQFFPPHGNVQELQERLHACRSRTLRSACVLLELHPKKSFTKPILLQLLVNYWQDSSAVMPRMPAFEEEPYRKEEAYSPVMRPRVPLVDKPPRKEEDSTSVGLPLLVEKPPRKEEVEVVYTKRSRSDEIKKTPMKKKTKNNGTDRKGGGLEDTMEIMAASLEKAKVVKEWAAAIEILSRVEGSTESITSIRKLIANVVDSATSEL